MTTTPPTLSIDATKMNALVLDALVQAIGDENRDALIRDALTWLNTRQSRVDPYSRRTEEVPSPIEDAFHVAMRKASQQIVNDMLAESAAQQMIRDVVQGMVDKLITDGAVMRDVGYQIGETLAERIVKSQ